MLFICYPKCSTCSKARAWLESHDLLFTERDIKQDPPRVEELAEWQKLSKLDLKKFFNTSGQVYRKLELKDRLPQMSDQEKLEILATDGMLVKRPLLVTDEVVLVGFKPDQWAEALLG